MGFPKRPFYDKQDANGHSLAGEAVCLQDLTAIIAGAHSWPFAPWYQKIGADLPQVFDQLLHSRTTMRVAGSSSSSSIAADRRAGKKVTFAATTAEVVQIPTTEVKPTVKVRPNKRVKVSSIH